MSFHLGRSLDSNPAGIEWQQLAPTENRRAGVVGTRPDTPAPALDKHEAMKSKWDGLIRNGATVGERKLFINQHFTEKQQQDFTKNLNNYKKSAEIIERSQNELNDIEKAISDYNAEIDKEKVLKKDAKSTLKKTFTQPTKIFKNIKEKSISTSLGTEKASSEAIKTYEGEIKKLEAEVVGLRKTISSLMSLNSGMIRNSDFKMQKHFSSTLETNTEKGFAKIDFNQITAPKSIDLENVRPQLIANDTVRSAVTCKDPTETADGTIIYKEEPTTQEDGTVVNKVTKNNCGAVDPRFEVLHGISRESAALPNNAGSSTVNAYNGESVTLGENTDAQRFCDAFHLENHSHYTLLVHADGSGSKQMARGAAQAAVAGATAYVNKALENPNLIKNGNDIRDILFGGVEAAQTEIFREPVLNENGEIVSYEKKNTLTDPAGATTFNMCFEYKDNEGTTYINNFSVGDSATFVFTRDSKTPDGKIASCVNLSAGSRDVDPLDAKLPGGQLGSANPDDSANLSNISFNAAAIPKDTNYLVLTMSDGVTDNLSPFNLGYSIEEAKEYIATGNTPSPEGRGPWYKDDNEMNLAGKETKKTPEQLKQQANVEKSPYGEWKYQEGVNKEAVAKIISDFQARKMQELVEKVLDKLGDDATPQQIMDEIADYCKTTTDDYRNSLKEGENDFLNHRELPGKLDHVSIVGYGGNNWAKSQ